MEKFEAQYKELLEKAEKFTDKVIIVGLTNVDDEKTDGYKNESVEKYNAVVKKIASEQKLPFVDLCGTLSKDELIDGLHPNTKGHQKIFEKVKAVLEV